MTRRSDDLPLQGLTVAHVGHHDPSYSRNRVIAAALRVAGAKVVEISDGRPFLRRTGSIVKALRTVRPDVIVTGFPGHVEVLTARLATLGRRVPVVFDAFVPLYEAAVEDRRTAQAGSFAARRYLLEDQWACRLADAVLVDTAAHGKYLTETVDLAPHKVHRIWVGTDERVMHPVPQDRHAGHRVFFYGSYTPLQGVEHIVRAAKLVERRRDDVCFLLVGSGQTYTQVRSLAQDLRVRSVEFRDRVAYEDLPSLIAASDVCLGIFGTTPKAARVIPNKVVDALATARPLITADTPAITEALVDGKHCRLCPPGNPSALAATLLDLLDDEEQRERIARQGHELFVATFSLRAIARDLARTIRALLR